MKKLLLSSLLLFSLFKGYAQSSLVLFNGTDTTSINADPVGYDGATAFIDSVTFPGNKFLHLMASDTGKYGGSVSLSNSTLLGYSGNVATTSLSFRASANDAASSLMILFRSQSNKTFGVLWDFTDSATSSTQKRIMNVIIPFSTFTNGAGDSLSTTTVVDSIFSTARSQIQFVFPDISGEVFISDIQFIPSFPLALEEEPAYNIRPEGIYPNPCNSILYLGPKNVNYTVANASGDIIDSGNSSEINVSNFNKGIYFVMLDNGLRQKVVIN